MGRRDKSSRLSLIVCRYIGHMPLLMQPWTYAFALPGTFARFVRGRVGARKTMLTGRTSTAPTSATSSVAGGTLPSRLSTSLRCRSALVLLGCSSRLLLLKNSRYHDAEVVSLRSASNRPYIRDLRVVMTRPTFAQRHGIALGRALAPDQPYSTGCNRLAPVFTGRLSSFIYWKSAKS